MIHDRTREFVTRFGVDPPLRIAEPIRIEVDDAWALNRNVQHAFLTAVNLTARLTDNVIVHSPKDTPLEVWHPIGQSSELLGRAREVCERVNHPARSGEASITIAFGSATTEGFVVRPSSVGWVAHVRTDGSLPPPPPDELNPLAAGLAASVAVSEAFKSILTKLGAVRTLPHRNTTYSLLVLEASTDGEQVPYPLSTQLGESTVVGAGALGHSLLFALRSGKHSGHIDLVDFDDLESTNLNRHLLADSESTGNKARFLAHKVADTLDVTPFPFRYEQYRVQATPLSRVVSLVDDRENNSTRKQIQSDLPQVLHHAATGDGSFTVLNVDFLNGGCLGCVFAPSTDDDDPATVLGRATGLSRARILELGPSGGLSESDLRAVARHRGLASADLAAFRGRPLQELLDSRLCGEQQLVTQKGRVGASAGFLSAAAGLVLAAEIVKASSDLRGYGLRNFLQASPFSLGDHNKRPLSKNPRCSVLCGEEIMRDGYQEKWGSVGT